MILREVHQIERLALISSDTDNDKHDWNSRNIWFGLVPWSEIDILEPMIEIGKVHVEFRLEDAFEPATILTFGTHEYESDPYTNDLIEDGNNEPLNTDTFGHANPCRLFVEGVGVTSWNSADDQVTPNVRDCIGA